MSGIGREIALQLAGRGVEVVVHGRSADRGGGSVVSVSTVGYVDGAVLPATGGLRAIAA
ncbi:hypothetical protein [Mycobacterium sp. E1747]|uniref:hypothetical protein n=1 Tax=Mycobacterium sp. E1747 TaxID=1834128 RepID=UPI000AF04333|nr:hypothetical protein [Mycobacterium sp. E1747]